MFACGIAKSGAYNRTLTPFGFQAEERTIWQAPEVYATMSPFLQVRSYASLLGPQCGCIIRGGLLPQFPPELQRHHLAMQYALRFLACPGFSCSSLCITPIPDEVPSRHNFHALLHLLWVGKQDD